MMQYFNIQVASQVSGVTSATIRAWEKRYKTVTPERASNGHRLYSNEDIQKLTLLSKLTEIGHNIGKIARLTFDELKEIYLHVFNHPFENSGIHFQDYAIEPEEVFQNISRAIKGKKFQIIGHELEKALRRSDSTSLCLNVILPLFKEIQESENKETLLNLFSFFLGKIIWDHISKDEDKEEIIIFSLENGILPLVLGVIMVNKGYTPYFIFHSEEELTKTNLPVIKTPSEFGFFLDLLNDLAEAPQRKKLLS